MAGDYRPFTIGDRWSRPWGTTWFRFSVDVPAALAGPQLEAVIDLGFHPDSAGFQSEGLVWIDGQPVQGIHPRRTGLPLPDVGAGPVHLLRRGRLESGVPRLPAVAARLARHGRRRSRCTGCATPRSANATTTCSSCCSTSTCCSGSPRRCRPTRPRRIRVLRQLEAAFNVLDLDRRRRHRGSRSARAATSARSAGASRRPPRRRRRPRPHRLGLAVADPRDASASACARSPRRSG